MSDLQGEYVPPRAERGPIPIWLGVGGNPGSAVRAAQLGLPMATGVLGGDALRPARLADLIGQQRGFHPPTRESYDRDAGPRGGMLVGSPEEIAERILLMHQHWGHVRQYIHIDTGGVPQKELLHAIELFGTDVRPLVQAELGTTTVDERLGRTPLSPQRDDPGARSPGVGSEPDAASVVRIGA